MSKPFISSTFNNIQLKILKLYQIYNSSCLLSVDRERLLRLIRNFEGELNKLNDMYFDLSGDIEKYVQHFENIYLDSNDNKND